MKDDITATEFDVVDTTRPTDKIQKIDIQADDEDGADVATALRSLVKKYTSLNILYVLKDLGLDGGDRVSVADILSAEEVSEAGLDAEDLRRELKLVRLDVSDFAVGDVIEVTETRNGNEDTFRGVVSEVTPGDEYRPARVKISCESGYSNGLEFGDGPVRAGQRPMLVEVVDVTTVDPDDIEGRLQRALESVLDSAGLDEQADEFDVETESEWGARDKHARVTVSGPGLDAPVTVHCRNIFDFGWTAEVESGTLDEDTERVVLRAARNNSPITTRVRT